GRLTRNLIYSTKPLNPFRKREIPIVPFFTIGMLIESARAGRWLYD
ncbi:DUF1493 family protein, partial [Cronobacter sakazakii]|nr:DUF1493 family protein [Cronobacter sakazakii]EME2071221.1 DUF1493 family protein [Cronobacter sakazakii]